MRSHLFLLLLACAGLVRADIPKPGDVCSLGDTFGVCTTSLTTGYHYDPTFLHCSGDNFPNCKLRPTSLLLALIILPSLGIVTCCCFCCACCPGAQALRRRRERLDAENSVRIQQTVVQAPGYAFPPPAPQHLVYAQAPPQPYYAPAPVLGAPAGQLKQPLLDPEAGASA